MIGREVEKFENYRLNIFGIDMRYNVMQNSVNINSGIFSGTNHQKSSNGCYGKNSKDWNKSFLCTSMKHNI